MAITEIKRYQTANGKTFDTREEAEQDEAKSELIDLLKFAIKEGVGLLDEEDTDAIIHQILLHPKQLAQLLQTYQETLVR